MSICAVADEAGVSKSTVSRVINNAPGVKPEVARLVRQAMARVGYQPSVRRPGRKPLSRRGIVTGNVALLAMGVDAGELYRLPVFPTLLHAIETTLRDQGLTLVLASLPPDGSLPAALLGNRVDGVLLLGKATAATAAVSARLRELPTVGLFRGFDGAESPVDYVQYNGGAVGPIAARHLLGRGHREVAFLSVLAPGRHGAFVRRERDFTATMQAGGGGVQVFGGDCEVTRMPPWEEYLPVVDRMLASAVRPTGAMIASDTQVPGFFQALKARGIAPMTDLDIVSCDNQEPFLSQVTPRPATIDLSLDLIGRRGVQQMLWRLRNPQEQAHVGVVIEPFLVLPAEQN